MLQDILEQPAWADILTPADVRGLTPLFWMHVLPYGEVNLDVTSRLNLGSPAVTSSHRAAGCNGSQGPALGVEKHPLPTAD